ncbi:putative ribonuclease H-like domain-containing protein [Tanacetum coccineum]|uniref:Ribonuclease H-like domain-containing protein n=1 Tax=Tanacetum coccineum TaxID=301880 RepID=A0ABQ5F7Z7_9ASTR
MSGNIAHLLDFKDFDGGYVTFGGGANGGRITGKGCFHNFDDASTQSVAYAQIQRSKWVQMRLMIQKSTHDDSNLQNNATPKIRLCGTKQLYGQIEEEVYVCQPPGFEDPDHPNKVYKVVKALYGLHQAPRAWYDTLANYLLCNGFERGKIDQTLFIKRHKGHILLVQIYVDDIIFGSTKKELCDEFEKLMKDKFQMSSMGELTFFLGLQVQQSKKGIFISQDKYVHEILRKFNYSDMIGSLMYLTASRPDIMFAVCACARFQVSPKSSHLLAVKRIFRYLKGKPSLGLWYSKDSPLELVAYTDSDYAGATQDRKSTTGGCQFLGNRLISWQCKKQTVVATSTTEAEYVAAASCCGQVLWIQNQLLDYGYNFMDTVIYIDNTSTICIIENPVQHSKTKHIEIRHHFIRDCNAKKLIQMAKIDTQHNVADLLTKGFDAGRFQYLVSIFEVAEVICDNGEVKITATIDGHSMTITKGSLRRHLKLDDQDGISSIPNSEIFKQLALTGYHTDSDKLTLKRPKKTAWEQFSSNIATAVICLATNRRYNFSRMIFEHMVSNISSPHKFLMYPRFIQICLDMQRNQLQQHTRTYPVPSLSMKVFNNMKRPTKGYSGQEVALFPSMLHVSAPSTSPSRITSSPSHSPEHSPSPTPSPSPEPTPDHTTAAATQPSPGTEHHLPTPHDSPLHAVHSHGSDEGSLKLNELTVLVTKLSDRIGVLEDDLRKTKKTYSSAFTKLILRVKKLEARVQDKASNETEPVIQDVTPTEVIQDQESSEKGSAKVSTASEIKDTAREEIPIVSIAEVNLSTAGGTVTYTRRSAEKRSRQDKGKAIMIKFEPKKEGNYKISDFKGMSYNDIRPIFEKVWDFNQNIEPMEHGTEKIKSPKKMKSPEKIVEEDVDIQEEMKEVMEEAAKKEELKGFLDIIPREEVPIEVASLSTKLPIMDWKTSILTENFMYYQVFRGDGSFKNYKVLSEMLEDFDRQDVKELFDYRQGKHEYNVISWSLYDFCGIHILCVELGEAIIADREEIPLSRDDFQLLKKKLEVDHESS